MDWINEGNKFFKEGDFEKSLNCYQKAIENDLSNTDALYNKALIHILQGEYKKSLDTSNRLIEIDRIDPEAWKLKGFALFNLEMYKEAVDAFGEAINLNPNDAYAWNNKGSALCYLCFFEEAIESFGKASSLDPRYLNALNNKKKAQSVLKQKRSTKGGPDLSEERKLSSETKRTLEFRGYCKLGGDPIIDLGPGPEMICPVDSCHYRVKLRTKGQRCPDHGVKLIIAGSK